MIRERRVKLFKNGRNQAVRIPREFELSGDEAVIHKEGDRLIIHKEGDRLIIELARPKSLLAVLKTLRSLDERFPPIPQLPVETVEL